MSDTEPPSELVPTPDDLVAVVAQMVEGQWPVTEDERGAFFKRIGFESGTQIDLGPNSSNVEMFELSTERLGKLSGAWNAYNRKFMGLYFHPYTFAEPNVLATRRGYDEIWLKLTDLFGQPTRPWDDEEVPPSIWKVNGRDIGTHYFNTNHSGVLLSVEDSELAAAAETEAHNQQVKRPREMNTPE